MTPDLAALTKSKADAIGACYAGGGLRKTAGAWFPVKNGMRRISGVTVADLGREGMLIIVTARLNSHGVTSGSARLTERGELYARALAEAVMA